MQGLLPCGLTHARRIVQVANVSSLKGCGPLEKIRWHVATMVIRPYGGREAGVFSRKAGRRNERYPLV